MLGPMFGIHPAYLVVLLAIVLIIFGPGRLPELGGAIGRAMREFQHTVNGLTRPPDGSDERNDGQHDERRDEPDR
jgi:sec-independent protein translocase protein TatA